MPGKVSDADEDIFSQGPTRLVAEAQNYAKHNAVKRNVAVDGRVGIEKGMLSQPAQRMRVRAHLQAVGFEEK